MISHVARHYIPQFGARATALYGGFAITPYEARTKQKPCLHHLHHIGQSGLSQNRKPYTG